MTIFYLIFLPFAAALVAPALTARLKHRAGWLLALVPAALLTFFASFIPQVSARPIRGGLDWIPSLDLRFSWSVDGLSLAFVLLISGIGALIILYSAAYLKGHPMLGRFLAFMLAFMGAMQGLVLADSFATLFVFWELTSITSFLLIGFNHTRESSRRAAIQALVVTGAGGLSLLAGLLLIWHMTGKTELSHLDPALRDSPFYLAALLLMLGAAFTKSAQVPFHFWLPNAMEAPAPVSAYLHSATMVKAGVYLLMRLNPVFGGTLAWHTILPGFGAVTLLTGAVLALGQRDLKLKLAYTTVSSLGLLVMLTGIGTSEAITAAALYLVAHSLFKGALFMVAGGVDKSAGGRDVTTLSGLRHALPVTFASAVLAALSMGGAPLFLGFLAKESTYEALDRANGWTIALLVAAIAGNAMMFAIGFTVALKPFLGRLPDDTSANRGYPLLAAGPLILATAGLVFAIGADRFHQLLTTPLASAIAGAPLTVDMSTVPHFGMPLLFSGATILLGIGIYWRADVLRPLIGSTVRRIGWGPDRGFDQTMRCLIRFASLVTRVVHNGRLDIYVTVVFASLAAALLVPMVVFGEWPSVPGIPDLYLHEWTIMVIAVIGLVAVVAAENRLTAIVSLGIQGFAVALLFLLLSAPDLSFTQFMIETLSVVVLALVMTRIRLLPTDHRPIREKMVDATVACACGLGLGLVLLKVTQLPFDRKLSDFFDTYSRTVAHGRNIVNVIIVDFRGLDTLGEISVVMVAALSILALIGIRAKSPPRST